MYLIDSHAHLSFFNFDQLDPVFSNTQNIREWILAGYDSADWQKQKSIYQKQHPVKMCFGLHPWRVLEMNGAQIDQELELLKKNLADAHACGETGIDGFRAKSSEEILKQEQVFLSHLDINRNHNLPMVLHVVKSHDKACEILKGYSYQGIVHGFSGSWDMAKKYISMGYKISLGRGLYQKGYKALKEVALKIDLKDFVVESDAYVSSDGEVEDPVAILLKVVQVLAEMKSVPVEKIGLANYENVKGIFG